MGFEPHDLRVMSPTSYQAALPRDINFLATAFGAGDRGRTGTILSYHGILSPGRLPVPPHRRITSQDLLTLGQLYYYITLICFCQPVYENYYCFLDFLLKFLYFFLFYPELCQKAEVAHVSCEQPRSIIIFPLGNMAVQVLPGVDFPFYFLHSLL